MSIIIALAIFIIPIILVISLIVAFVKKSKDSEKSDEIFEKNIRTIYVYIVAIIFLFIVAFSVIGAANSTINYFLPENTAYYVNSEDQEIDIKNTYIVNLITAIGAFAISMPLFLYHIKLAKASN